MVSRFARPESDHSRVNAQEDSQQRLFDDAYDKKDPSGSRTYNVKSGDTMSSIGVACGVPYLTIIDLNPDVEPRRMSVGQELIMPPGAQCVADVSVDSSSASQETAVVQEQVEPTPPALNDTSPENFTDRLLTAIYGVEAPFNGMTRNQYYAANGALSGDGLMQVGVCQWYQKGEMHNLLSHWNAANQAKFSEYFGDYAAKMINPDGSANIGYITTNNFWNLPGFPERMQNALNDPEFQAVQVQLFAAKVSDAAAFAGSYGIKSEFGVALLFQIINQRGYGGAQHDLNATNVQARLSSGESELAVLKDLNSYSGRPNYATTWDFLLSHFSPDTP